MAYNDLPPLGQAAMTASLPVVIASDQSAIPISNAGLTELAAAINASSQMDVNIAANGIGLSTSAKQDTGNTSLATIAGAVAGTEMQVDVLTMPTVAVTNAGLTELAAAINVSSQMDVNIAANGIGLATSAKQDTIIGHLDGVEGLLTTIDADTGSILLAVDGIEGLLTTENTNSGAMVTALQLIDDAVYASDAAISKVIAIGGQFDDTTPGTTTENSVRAIRMSTRREMYIQVRDAAGNERGQNVDASGNAGVVLAAETSKVIGTIRIASGGVASGSFASGSIASGAIASGAIASGAIAAGAIAAGATSIATTEDTASAAADHLVKVAQIRLDTPVSGANVSASGDYTQFIADSFGKTWVTGTYAEDLAHVAGEAIMGMGARRIDTLANSAGTSGDWATVNQTAEGALYTTTVPTTNGGLTTYHLVSAATTNATSVKASAGQLYGYYIYNSNAAARKLVFHNTAGTPTAGASVFFSIVIPPTSGANVEFTNGIAFSTGIGITTVTGLADSDSAAVAANDLIINLFYK